MVTRTTTTRITATTCVVFAREVDFQFTPEKEFQEKAVYATTYKTKIKMDKNQDAPLYLKIFQMTKYLHLIVKNFPKEYKYDLGKEMQNLAWKCLDEFLEANSSPNAEKFPKIINLSNSFDEFKTRIRMGRDLNLITEKQFIHLQASHIQGIGEMIGGWMEWSRTNYANHGELQIKKRNFTNYGELHEQHE